MNFQAMRDFMDRLCAWRIPGNSVSVCLGGKEVFSYQAGYADLENKIPMSEDKLFNIFSCSKPVTVTAALQLYERGYFLLDDPLYDFIPEYRRMVIKDADGNLSEAKNSITLRQLFTMTSGMTYNLLSPAFEKARALTEGRMNTLVAAKCFAEEPLTFEPGTRWQYSLSHDILAAVVEVISGKRFRDYVKENIFEPLEMKDSYYHNDAVRDRMAEMYRYVNGGEEDMIKLQSGGGSKDDGGVVNVGKDVSFVFGSEYDSGGAGITTTVADCSKFASALAGRGVGRNGERILSSGTVELLRQNQLSPAQSVNFNWSQLKGYGYGLGVRTLVNIAESGSTGSLGEFGWGGAAGATFLIDPDIGLSVFYAHHMLNAQEDHYQPRLRNVVYACIG